MFAAATLSPSRRPIFHVPFPRSSVATSALSRSTAPAAARALEEAAVDRRHVHVLGFLEDGATRRRLRFQQRLAAESLGRVEPAHARHEAGIIGGRLLHRRLLLGAAGDQRTTRREQGMAGKTRRRLAIEAARRHRDGADLRAAIGLRMQRRRAAGRVIGGDMLALQHDHPGMGREVVGGGDPGDAGADDGEIEILHEPHIARSLPGLQ